LVDAAVKTGATSHGLINPAHLEKALQKSIGKRNWLRGNGGAAREVTEALKRLEMSRWESGGALQASSLPNAVLRVAQGLVGIPLSSKTAGAIGRGEHMLGKALRNTKPETRRLVKALGGFYHGVPGAMASDE
jgi:hypothetical protein